MEALVILIVISIFVIFLCRGYKGAGSAHWICTNCGFIGNRKKITKGSIPIEILLWICFLLPGLIYTVWRLTTRYFGCPECAAVDMIPVDSPKGKRLLQEDASRK